LDWLDGRSEGQGSFILSVHEDVNFTESSLVFYDNCYMISFILQRELGEAGFDSFFGGGAAEIQDLVFSKTEREDFMHNGCSDLEECLISLHFLEICVNSDVQSHCKGVHLSDVFDTENFDWNFDLFSAVTKLENVFDDGDFILACFIGFLGLG